MLCSVKFYLSSVRYFTVVIKQQVQKMPLVCPICRDVLEGSCVEGQESELVAGECGHVFHKRCLCRWIEQGQSDTANCCPCCRKAVSASKFIPLYPTSCSTLADLDSSDDILALKSTINELKDTVKSLQDKLKEKDLAIVDLKIKLNELTATNNKLVAANKVWINIAEKKDFYKKGVVSLKAKVQSLQLSLARYKSVQKLVTMAQPCADLSKRSGNQCCMSETKNIVEENKLLSSQLQSLKKKYDKLKDDHDYLNIRLTNTNMLLHESVQTNSSF